MISHDLEELRARVLACLYVESPAVRALATALLVEAAEAFADAITLERHAHFEATWLLSDVRRIDRRALERLELLVVAGEVGELWARRLTAAAAFYESAHVHATGFASAALARKKAA